MYHTLVDANLIEDGSQDGNATRDMLIEYYFDASDALQTSVVDPCAGALMALRLWKPLALQQAVGREAREAMVTILEHYTPSSEHALTSAVDWMCQDLIERQSLPILLACQRVVLAWHHCLRRREKDLIRAILVLYEGIIKWRNVMVLPRQDSQYDQQRNVLYETLRCLSIQASTELLQMALDEVDGKNRKDQDLDAFDFAEAMKKAQEFQPALVSVVPETAMVGHSLQLSRALVMSQFDQTAAPIRKLMSLSRNKVTGNVEPSGLIKYVLEAARKTIDSRFRNIDGDKCMESAFSSNEVSIMIELEKQFHPGKKTSESLTRGVGLGFVADNRRRRRDRSYRIEYTQQLPSRNQVMLLSSEDCERYVQAILEED